MLGSKGGSQVMVDTTVGVPCDVILSHFNISVNSHHVHNIIAR